MIFRIGNRSNGVTFKSIAQGAFSRDLLDDDNGTIIIIYVHEQVIRLSIVVVLIITELRHRVTH